MLDAFKLNRATLRQRVLLMAADPNGERFSPEDVHQAIHDALLDFCMKTQYLKDKHSIEIAGDQSIYDLRQAADDGARRPFAAVIRLTIDSTAAVALRQYGTVYRDQFNRSRDLEQSFSIDLVSHGQVSLYPRALEGGVDVLGNLFFEYLAMPNWMEADDEYPDTLSAQFHPAIVVGAAALLLECGNESDIAVAEEMDREFYDWQTKVTREEYRQLTHYNNLVRPM